MSELLSAHTTMKNLDERIELFKKAKTRQELAEAIGYSYKFIVFFVFAKDVEQHYTEFNIAKGYKGERIIAAPNEKLKQIQKNIAEILLAIYTPKDCVNSFVRNKNVATNARPHVKARHILRLDLENFFPSIHFGRVRNLFEATFNFPREVSTLLARICCFKGSLPQGAPTSPIISNMICLRLDGQLTRLANDCQCKYTRYADDITFSSKAEIFSDKIIASISPLKLSDKLLEIIEVNNYFKLNHHKTHLCSNHDSKFITGIKVNQKLNVSRKKYREVRAMLHAVRTHGHDKALAEHIGRYSRRKRSVLQTNFYHIIQGKIAFLGMVRGKYDPIVAKLKLQLECLLELENNKVNKRIVEKAQGKLQGDCALIICEGKTDRIYLSFAYRKLRNQGFFRNLNLLFYIWTAAEGCSAGINDLKAIPRKGLLGRYAKFPRIYIFDRDIQNPHDYVNTLKGHEAPRYWGENTWSFLLHEPAFRAGYGSSISIEHFLTDDILFTTDEEGRRLYCSSQFDDGVPISSAKAEVTPSSNGKKPKKRFTLKDDPEVYFEAQEKKGQFVLLDDKIAKGTVNNIARSKFSLARQVVTSDQIATNSLDEFAKIFVTIEDILKKAAS